MEHAYPSRFRFSLFYVSSLFVLTFLIIHFIRYTDDKLPSKELFREVITDSEPVKKTLPVYNYNSLSACNLDREVRNPRVNLTDVGVKLKQCAFPLFPRFFSNPEGLMFNWQTVMSICDHENSVEDIELRKIGADKWAVFPSCQEDSVLVVLGASRQTRAEEQLSRKIGNLMSHGTDPFEEKSTAFKHFYRFALSEGQKEIEMEVERVNRTVVSKGIREFLLEDVKSKKIDMLWINRNYGNFPFWNYLRADGELRKMGIVVCQMMIEVPNEMGEQWVQMISPLERNSNFIFMRPKTTKDGGATAFFVNYVDPECTRKYLE
ncbi:unnamed protein product [Caenorhabditis sp. 36 PRJEB53466]|nr:unnamed protein product [Caenorhabditis sp. 36 PRJEB53466]